MAAAKKMSMDGAIAEILSQLDANFTPTENHLKNGMFFLRTTCFQFTPDLL